MLSCRKAILGITAIALFASVAAAAEAQASGWSTPWNVVAAPTFAQGSLAAVAVDASGNIVLAAPSSSTTDYQVVSLSRAGALNWSVNIDDSYGVADDGTNVLRTDSDGSTFLSFSNPVDGFIAKLDVSGQIAWTRYLPSAWLVASPSGSLIVGGCEWIDFAPSLISAVNRDTGAVNWQVPIRGTSPRCELADVLVDSNGNVYASTRSLTYSGPNTNVSAHLYKINANGHEVWNVAVPISSDPPRLIGADATHVYLRYDDNVTAIDATDGSVAWTVGATVTASAAIVVGDPAEPVVLTNDRVERLAAESGQLRWTSPVPGAQSINVVNGAIVAAGPSSGSGMWRLDPGTGAIVWSITLPTIVDVLSYLPVQPLDGNTLLAPAKYFYTPGAPVPVLQTLDFATGQFGASIPVPSVTQGLVASSALGADARIEGISTGRAAGTFEIRMRELNADDGSVQWEANQPLPVGCLYCDESLGATSDATSAVGLYAWNDSVYSPPGVRGSAWLGVFDKLTGNRRWDMQLSTLVQGETLTADPVLASNGDVLIGVGTSLLDDPLAPDPVWHSRQTVYKFAAVDGHQVWNRAIAGPIVSSSTQIDPPLVNALGDDVVATGQFEMQPVPSTVVRLSGMDGSTQWASSVFSESGVNELYTTEDANLIVVSWTGWAKIDGTTGAAVWTGTIPSDPNCTPTINSCVLGDGKALSGGDILYSGFAADAPWLRRLRGDGSRIVDDWHVEATVPGVRSSVSQIFEDSAGNLWLRLTRSYRDAFTSIQMLARFDPATGQFLDQQVIGNNGGDPLTATTGVNLLGPPQNDRLPVDTFQVNHPQPSTAGNAVLDTTVHANGDLLAESSTDVAEAVPGKMLTFHFAAVYTGDAAVSGVTLIGKLPWSSGASGIACATTAATNCVVGTASGNLHATFDIQPGGRVDISGQVRVLETAASTLHVEEVVYGPIGLREPDTANNLSRTNVAQAIFSNGFEE